MPNQDGVNWIKGLLQEIDKTFPPKKNARANITVGSAGDLEGLLVFSFLTDKGWISFGLVDDDLTKTPQKLIEEVKKDLDLEQSK